MAEVPFNQRARDSSSRERTKEKRWIVRFGAFLFALLASARPVHGFCTVHAFRVGLRSA